MRVLLAVVLALMMSPLAAWPGDPAEKAAKDNLEMGYEAARHGYWQEALTRYETANRLDPGNAEVLNNMGVAFEAVGRWDEARAAYGEAMQLDPGASEIRRNYRMFEEFQQSFVERKEPAPEDEVSASEDDSELAGGSEGEDSPAATAGADEEGEGTNA